MEYPIANDQFEIPYKRSQSRVTYFVKILTFCFAVAVAIVTKNAFASFFVFSAIVLWDREFLLPVLLFTPLIETVLLAIEGVTITRLLAFFVAALLVSELILKNRFRFDTKNFCLFFFALVTLFGTLNAVLTGEYFISIYWQGNVLREYLVSAFSKVFFTIVLYSYLKDKGAVFLRKSLENGTIVLSIGIIMACIYFIYVGHETTSWYSTVTRMTFLGANPNDFSKILISLGVFPLYLFLLGNSRFQTLLGFFGFLLVSYSVFLTLSRGGIATLGVLFAVAIFVIYKYNKKRAIVVSIMFCAVLIGAFYTGLFDFISVYERFFGSHVQDITSLTAGRTDYWVSGLEAFFEKPILGHGGTRFASMWINYGANGKRAVMHNLYLEILVQYGILGSLAFLTILVSAFKGFFGMRKYLNVVPWSTVFFIPYLSLFSILFAGLAASWQWREILWYFIGLAMATSAFVENKFEGSGYKKPQENDY